MSGPIGWISRRWVGVVVAVGLIGALVPAVSEASPHYVAPKIYSYKATFTGSGSYDYDYTAPSSSVTATATFHWDVKFPRLTFIAGKVKGAPSGEAGGGEANTADTPFAGSWKVNVTSTDGDDCTGSGGLVPGQIPAVASVERNPLVKGGFVITVPAISGAPAESTAGADDCSDIGGDQTSDFWNDWAYGHGVGGTSDMPIVTAVALKPSKEGKVIERVKVDPKAQPPSDCGTTSSVGVTCMESYDWSGEVTLTRLSSGS
jgi:hypothetical protein